MLYTWCYHTVPRFSLICYRQMHAASSSKLHCSSCQQTPPETVHCWSTQAACWAPRKTAPVSSTSDVLRESETFTLRAPSGLAIAVAPVFPHLPLSPSTESSPQDNVLEPPVHLVRGTVATPPKPPSLVSFLNFHLNFQSTLSTFLSAASTTGLSVRSPLRNH